MSASYPASAKSFTAINAGDTITDTMWEDAYDEITAVEQALLTGLAHDLKFTDATYDIGKSGATRPRDLFLSRNLTLGGVATGAAQPRAGAYHATTQSLTNNTETAVLFNTEDYDVGAMHDTASNTSRFTVPTGGDGLYLLTGTVDFIASATGIRYLRWRKNGATAISGTMSQPGNASYNTQLVHTVVAALVAGDYVELVAYQDSGGALNIGDAATRYIQNTAQIVKLW